MTGDRAKLMTLALAIVVALTIRLLPVEYRLWNMTAVGALALFAGARIGLWQSLLTAFGVLLVTDFVQFWQHDYNQHYLPFASVYCAYAMYGILGWALLRRCENPFVIGAGVQVAGLAFFAITNFVSWLSPIHGYERSFSGLMTCYEAALPFLKGTLAGDLVFSGLFFGTYAVLSRAQAPAREAVTVES